MISENITMTTFEVDFLNGKVYLFLKEKTPQSRGV